MCFGIRFQTSASFRFPHFRIHEELNVPSLFLQRLPVLHPNKLKCPNRFSFILINKIFFFIIIWNNNSVEVTLVFVDYTFSFFLYFYEWACFVKIQLIIYFLTSYTLISVFLYREYKLHKRNSSTEYHAHCCCIYKFTPRDFIWIYKYLPIILYFNSYTSMSWHNLRIILEIVSDGRQTSLELFTLFSIVYS